MNKVMLSIGHGFSARALGQHLLNEGWIVYGTTRSKEKAAALRREGIEPIIWPETNLLPYLEKATHILTSVAPNPDGDPVLYAYGEELSRGSFEWVGYLSTTGVYGNHDGGWVDEDTQLNPTTKRGEMRRNAEAAWSTLGLPLHIFRLRISTFSKRSRGTAPRTEHGCAALRLWTWAWTLC